MDKIIYFLEVFSLIYLASAVILTPVLRFWIIDRKLNRSDLICIVIPVLNTVTLTFIVLLASALITEYLLRKMAPKKVRKSLGI